MVFYFFDSFFVLFLVMFFFNNEYNEFMSKRCIGFVVYFLFYCGLLNYVFLYMYGFYVFMLCLMVSYYINFWSSLFDNRICFCRLVYVFFFVFLCVFLGFMGFCYFCFYYVVGINLLF